MDSGKLLGELVVFVEGRNWKGARSTLESLLQRSLDAIFRNSVTRDDTAILTQLLHHLLNAFSPSPLSSSSSSPSSSSPFPPPSSSSPSSPSLSTAGGHDENDTQASILILKLARNLCVGSSHTQLAFLDERIVEDVVNLITWKLKDRESALPLPADKETTDPNLQDEEEKGELEDDTTLVVVTALQLLGNLCVRCERGKECVWRLCCPETLKLLSVSKEPRVVDMCCMLLHQSSACGDTCRMAFLLSQKGIEILASLLSATEETLEWRTILLDSLLDAVWLGDVYSHLEKSIRAQAFLLQHVLIHTSQSHSPSSLPLSPSHKRKLQESATPDDDNDETDDTGEHESIPSDNLCSVERTKATASSCSSNNNKTSKTRLQESREISVLSTRASESKNGIDSLTESSQLTSQLNDAATVSFCASELCKLAASFTQDGSKGLLLLKELTPGGSLAKDYCTAGVSQDTQDTQVSQVPLLLQLKNIRVILELLTLVLSRCQSKFESFHLFLELEETSLFETVLELLRCLSELDGSDASSKHRSPLRLVKPTGVEHLNPLFGLKRDLVRLIGNLCYRSKAYQSKVREMGSIPLILNQTSIDHHNPYITQWAVFAVRNICEDNPANQALIASLEKMGMAGSGYADLEFGNEIEIGDDGKVRTKDKNKKQTL